MKDTSHNWFQNWFDTPYYHMLYAHRDFNEAERFMKNLISFIDLPRGSEILDIPCGRGRHAIYLNKLGYRVTGADLSEQNIQFAKKYENESLHFFVHDMRQPLTGKYDAVFNLFTSFGYFNDDENVKVLQHFKSALKPGGILVIDFLNLSSVCENLIPEEIVERNGIAFRITRSIDKTFLIKRIEFEDQGKSFCFEERVRCLGPEEFKEMIIKADLQIEHIFGDYDLQVFDMSESDRLIMLLR